MITRWIAARWRCEGGYRQVLKVAIPLMLSTAAWSAQYFVDRMFLLWYSKEAISASMQASMMSFTALALFLATASYCNTFVAQYVGAKQPGMVGRAVWQAVFFSIGAGILLFAIRSIGGPVFRWVGHNAVLQEMEVTYFRIILAGAIFPLVGDAVASFFSGRAETWTIMWVNFVAVGVNIFLNWLWIFGHWGFPEMGVAGAAKATVVAYFVRGTLFFLLMARRKYRHKFGIFSGFCFDRGLFFRLIRFGLPSGVTFSLDILVWTLFVAVIGNIGVKEFAATTVTFQINTIAFMPMIGIGIAVSTLVGQYMGKKNPDLAARCTWSAMHISILYMGSVAILFLTIPGVFLAPFGANADPEEFPAIAEIVKTLLRFVAIYTFFDGIIISISGALKGAGDTRFPVVATLVLSWTVMLMPIITLYKKGFRSIKLTWLFAILYLVSLAITMVLRFLWGKWRTMKVIEEVPPPHIMPHADIPPIDIE